jgi:hypothetical protein
MAMMTIGARLFTLALAGLVGLSATSAAGQSYRAPRNAYGAPDLNGVWNNNALTRLQRPAGVLPLVVRPADVAAAEHKLMGSYSPPATVANVGGTDSEWWDGAHLARVDGQFRTSWLVDPDDGQLPYSAEGKRRRAVFDKAQVESFDGPEARPVAGDRCLLPSWGAMGPVMMNAPYNANYRFVQTRDQIAILAENNSEVRIIRIGAAHLPGQIKQWTGDSIGHWEKDTLVVETTNLRADAPLSQAPFFFSAEARVVERFTRTGPAALKYEFTVEDPVIFARPWRAEMAFVASDATLFEFACHEGNYAMTNVLAGARAVERTEASAAADDPLLGAWKLNIEKSRFTPGPGWRSQVRVYRAVATGITVEWTGVDAGGEKMQVSYTYAYDGRDYPMNGSANYETLNAVRIDARTGRSEEKRAGKIVGIAVRSVSPDGKTLTITDDGVSRKGQAFSQVLVFDRVTAN